MQVLRYHSTTNHAYSTSVPCAVCCSGIYMVQLGLIDGMPVNYYIGSINNAPTKADAYTQQIEDEWEAKKAIGREMMWDILCALPVEGET